MCFFCLLGVKEVHKGRGAPPPWVPGHLQEIVVKPKKVPQQNVQNVQTQANELVKKTSSNGVDWESPNPSRKKVSQTI